MARTTRRGRIPTPPRAATPAPAPRASRRASPPPPPPPAQLLSIVQGMLGEEDDTLVLVTSDGLHLTIETGDLPDAAKALARLQQRVGRPALVRGRQLGGALQDARLVERPTEIDDTAAFAPVRAALAKNGAALRAIPGVLALRPGYRFTDGWTDGTPCIVAVTAPPSAEAGQGVLPAEVEGVPIDAAPASPLQQLARQAATAAPDASAAPSGDDAVANPAGYALPPAAAPEPGVLTFEPQLIRKSRYRPPSDVKLTPVAGPVDVLCHASPDAGWPTLHTFLAATKRSLTVAMYDFTAPHILAALSNTFATGATLELLLDPRVSLSAGGEGENPKADDQREDVVVQALRQRLRDRFKFEWAAVKLQDKTTGGIFPSAYHIKVAVRDGTAMWLSSGNWQSSNQPPFDMLHDRPDVTRIEGIYNREWHVVIDDARLAHTYERFIEWDYKQAGPLQAQPALAERPDLLLPEPFETEAAFAPRVFAPRQLRVAAGEHVQPLLTPDNYATKVLPLLAGAKRSIWFQNQYIHFSRNEDQNPPEFLALVGALRDQIEAGLDVRILLREIGDTREMIEALIHYGIPAEHMRLQKAAHNKGILIDDDILVLGSHNWSGDGTVYNRDASLIFHSPTIAAYYKPIFDYDWQNPRTTAQRIPSEDFAPQIATGPAPAGQVRVPWGVYYGDSQPGFVQDAIDRLAQRPTPSGFTMQSAILPASVPATARAAPLPKASPVGDLMAARDELTHRYLTSPQAVEISRQAIYPAPQPEANVIAVGIGEKVSEGLHTGTLAVHLFVRVKYTRSSISPRFILPAQFEGVPIDVTEIGEMRKLADFPDPRRQLTPVQPGCSIGFAYPNDAERMAGTLGALLSDPQSGRTLLLSNSHVLANEGQFPQGTPIYQTGLLDLATGATKRQIATLLRAAPLTADPLRVDAAVALLDPHVDADPAILHIGRCTGTGEAATDMIVHKFGRTSDYTVGRVVSVATNLQLRYETGLYTFREQILVTSVSPNKPFSRAGDSGALVVERASGRAVGLLFAGSSTHSAANHIADVLAAFPGARLQ